MHSRDRRTELANAEHRAIMDRLKDHLVRYHRVARTKSIYNTYSEHLQQRINLRYMTPLSTSEQRQVHKELNLVRSIRRKLKKYKLMIRQTDKSGVFCVLRTSDHELKVKEYRDKTEAYRELPSNPFDDTIRKVTRLLNDLHKKYDKIRAGPYIEMWPNAMKCKLAYIYFNPKTHKVC